MVPRILTAFQKRACESNEDSKQQSMHADETIEANAIQGPHPTQTSMIDSSFPEMVIFYYCFFFFAMFTAF